MKKKNKANQTKKNSQKKNKGEMMEKTPLLTSRLKCWIASLVFVVAGVVVGLSFFDKAGSAGQTIFNTFNFVVGKTVYFLPFLFFGVALLPLRPAQKKVAAPIILSLSLLSLSISGIFAIQNTGAKDGGWLGFLVSSPILRYFDTVVAWILFIALGVVGLLIVWEFSPRKEKKEKEEDLQPKEEKVPVLIKEAKTDQSSEKPKFQIKSIELIEKKKELGGVKEKPKTLMPVKPEKLKLPLAFGGDYAMPPLSLFDIVEEKPSAGDIEYNSSIIRKTLLNFGIEVEMANTSVGPTVTQYTLKPAEGVKLSKITTLSNDLALALSAHPIRIEAPIPGKPLVGIEVPNKTRAVVKIGNLIGLPEFKDSTGRLTLALGKDVMGKAVCPDLGAMPHLLVAGATGSGKTICLNALILSLICKNSPKLLRLILIDPKRVEFPVYANLPHLLTPVIFNSQKAVNALNWLVGEMERRFDVLQEFGARDITTYNKTLQEKPRKIDEGFEVMPYIILIIDELADLMMSKGKEVEAAVVRISQLARAVGIHLILATQRPSVEVITGLIKANITSRVAFQVASQIDSRTILDCAGSEKLLGKGDMLYLSSEFSKPRRIQGNFVTMQEIRKVVNFIDKENSGNTKPMERNEGLPSVLNLDEPIVAKEENDRADYSKFSLSVSPAPKSQVASGNNGSLPAEIDLEDVSLEEPLYNEAKQVIMEYGRASASLLQRRMKIGYARAARILDLLEKNGVVGPQEGSRPREVYGAELKRNDGYQDASDISFDYK